MRNLIGLNFPPTARDVIIPDYSAQGSRILRIHSGYSGIGITVNRTTILVYSNYLFLFRNMAKRTQP